MKTDKELYELYSSDPDELYKILDREFPERGVEIRIEQHKQIESTSDLFVLPKDSDECCHVIENEGRTDKNIHARGLISAGLFANKYPDRQHELHLVYLNRSLDPYATTSVDGSPRDKPAQPPCLNFAPTVHYLDERVRQIATTDPDSPLVSVFFPLLEKDAKKVEREFRHHYDNLKESPALPEPARQRWLGVFQLWLMRTLDLDNLNQIEEMLTEHLPAVEETVWGKELIEKYEEKGREEGLEKGIEKGIEKGREEGEIRTLKEGIAHYDRLLKSGILSAEAHSALVASAQQTLEKLRSNRES